MKQKYLLEQQLPPMLSVPQVAAYLGISRANAYALTRRADFPAMRIGRRIIVPRERFLNWIREQFVSQK